MTEREDPPRWSDGAEAPAALGDLLSSAKRETATEAELAELGARLSAVLKPAPVVPALLKLAAGGLLAALGVGSALYATHRSAEPPEASSAAQRLGLAHDAPKPSLGPPPDAPTAPALPPAPLGERSPVPPAASPKRKLVAAPSATSESNGSATEATLLEQARSNLASNPSRALALTQRHAAQFPHGILTQEREVIAISALRRLGRTREADARAARFDMRYPNSAHQQLVDSPAPR
jgi:hypothetical protein